MADKVDEKLMLAALAVKRGEQKLGELNDGQREKVRKVLRTTRDETLREFARSQAKPTGRRVAQRAPQTKFRRARAY